MGTSKVEATTYACDRDGCTKTHTVTGEGEPAGLELTVKIDGVARDVYSCGKQHVGPAVSAVIEAWAADPDAVGDEDAPDEPDPRDELADDDADADLDEVNDPDLVSAP